MPIEAYRRRTYVQNVYSTKRLLDKTSPRQNVSIQNVSIQNVYTHSVSLTKHILNETSPVTKRLRNKTSPRHIFNVLDRLYQNSCRIEFCLLWLG
jgi:23S rRNA maturation mini-RNase III